MPALANPGSCISFDFSKFQTSTDQLDWTGSVRVLRQDAALHPDATTSQVTDQLDFDVQLRVVRATQARLQVRRAGSDVPLGWVARADLLCGVRPLKGDSGLEQKFYIKTGVVVRASKPATLTVSHDPARLYCKSQCRELSKFSLHFIVATEGDSVLLAVDFLLDDRAQLVGWVKKNQGYLWDTAYGLRPRDDLRFQGGDGTICAYRTLADAQSRQKCIPILAGTRWYQIAHRIPLLGRVGEDVYKVALPLPGVITGKQEGGELTISPELLGENPGISFLREQLLQVDVMFLIDGTASMEPFIAKVRGEGEKLGIVQTIVNTLKDDPNFKETQFRFGFRIYRDAYAGELNLGEGLPLADDTCESTEGYQTKNLQDFRERIAQVRVSKNDEDDYEENLFGGLKKVLMEDLRSCPQHRKMLFVIGDHGYNATVQLQRGITPVTVDELVPKLKGDVSQKTANVVLSFIQTPDNSHSAADPQAYKKAYDLFSEQAQTLLRQILPRKHEAEQYLHGLNNEAGLITQVMKTVQQFAPSRVADAIIIDLRGGAALKDVIERLKGQYDLPGLYWDLIVQGSCKDLGEQCERRVYDTTLEGYIPVSEPVVPEVWMTSEELTSWRMVLESFKGSTNDLSGSELRAALVKALMDSLQAVIKKPPIEATGETFAQYAQRRGGLPVREHSPLFGYDPGALLNPQRIPQCEIERLATWGANAERILSIVYQGIFRPKYQTRNYPSEHCPNVSDKGNRVPFVDGPIEPIRLGNTDEFNYCRPLGKWRVCWIPQEFLP